MDLANNARDRAGPAAKDLPKDAPEKGEKMIRALLGL